MYGLPGFRAASSLYSSRLTYRLHANRDVTGTSLPDVTMQAWLPDCSDTYDQCLNGCEGAWDPGVCSCECFNDYCRCSRHCQVMRCL